jgi:hypothetical protein
VAPVFEIGVIEHLAGLEVSVDLAGMITVTIPKSYRGYVRADFGKVGSSQLSRFGSKSGLEDTGIPLARDASAL